jgi:hypothetical protein
MSRYRGMSLSLGAKNLGVMNLDVRMMNHHVNWWLSHCVDLKMGDHLKNLKGHCVDLKIDLVSYASYYRHDLMDVNLNYWMETYLFLISLVVARYLVVLCNEFFVANVTYVT